jgi:hypothetical protein
LPLIIENESSNLTKNVWLPWKYDSREMQTKAVEIDTLTGNFELELFIKDRFVKE